MSDRQKEIGTFIVNQVESYPAGLVLLVARKYGFSRQRAHAYVIRETKKGTIVKTGNTNATRYFLTGGKNIEFDLEIKPGLAEDQVWSKYIKPMVANYPKNIYRICNYGFTEIFNNAIDHSDGNKIFTNYEIKNGNIIITIIDNGVGIFKKIQDALQLETIRESLLHLSKGKFTTDPTKHTGEGIFFTSRMVDNFSILSSDLYYSFRNEDWFLSSEKKENFGKGTLIRMSINLDSQKTPRKIMDKYSDAEIGFGKTIVAVALSADPNDLHVSRSQAKRLLMGLDQFKTIILDFVGVESVGQAFVDEVFRVFKNEYPNINLSYINANDDIEYMIKRGLLKS